MSKNKGVKKTLAVFMAALMVLSCWVFTPIATEAEAAEAGRYYYEIVINVARGVTANHWTQWAWTLTGTTADGTVITKYIEYPITTEKGTVYTLFSGYEDFFPTKLESACRLSNYANHVVFDLSINVGKDRSSALTTVGTYKNHSLSNPASNSEGDWRKNNTYNVNVVIADNYKPKAAGIVWTRQPDNIAIPGSTKVESYAVDQYGVKLACDPSYSLSTNPSNAEITVANDGTVSAQKAAQMLSGNECLTNVNASYTYNGATVTSTSNQFTVSDPYYTVTLNGNGGAILTDSSVRKQYGDTYGITPSAIREGYKFNGFKNGDATLDANTVITSDTTWTADWSAESYNATFNYMDADGTYKSSTNPFKFGTTISIPKASDVTIGDTTYKFDKWSPSVDATMPAHNVTYTATYKVSTSYADLTALNNAITAANNAKNAENYADKYTAETRAALESTLTAAQDLVGSKPLKSQQTAVNDLAAALESAVANLTVKKFVVLFVDEDDAVINNGYSYVEWGESVTVPAAPTKAYDSKKHYTFSGWNEDPTEACKSVKADKVFKAQFTEESHNFDLTPISSTCTTDGATKYTCSCGYSYTATNIADKAHHSFAETTVKEATCSDNGIKANVCSVCGVCEKDSITSIPKTTHTYGSWTTYTASTCAGEGVEYRECACGAREYKTTNKTSHGFGDTTVVAPTCTTKGYSKHTCSMCGLVEIFDETSATGHNNNTTTVNPTCVSAGYKETKCSTCGHTTIEWLEATGSHAYGDWTYIADSSCTVKGVKTRACSVCGRTEIEIDENLGDHSWAAEKTIDYDSTCSTVGQKSIHCTVCGQIKTDTKEEIAKKSHEMGEPEIVLDATCDGQGVTKTVCKNCGYTETAKTPALGHAYGKTSETKATCTVDGELVETCGKCHDVKTTVLPKTGHNYVAGAPVAATCKSSGYIPYTCSGCGDTYNVISGTTAEHSWNVTSVVDHDKTVVTSTCSVCGEEVTHTVNGTHKFTRGTVTTPATCTTDGIVTVNCEIEGCGESYTINIGKGGHTVATKVTEPECETAGKAVSYCTTCNTEISSMEIKAKGHSYKAEITKSATCTEKGIIKYTCSSCGDTYTEDIEIDANAHNFTKVGETVNATCTSPAYDEYKCVCGKTHREYIGTAGGHSYVTTQTQTGSTLKITCECSSCHDKHEYTTSVAEGHNYSVVSVTKQPTCHTKGEVKISCDKVHDSNCSSSVTVELDINANAHNFNTTYNYPTCESEGSVVTTCVNGCGYKSTAKLSKLSHEWGEGSVTTGATCTTDGVMTFTCTRKDCGKTRTEVIAKTGHSFVAGTTHEATCVDAGYIEYSCENDGCTVSYNEYTSRPLGHDWNDGEIIVEGNCEKLQVTRYTCKRCEETKDTISGETATHNYEYKGVVAPTCTEQGYDKWECSECGDINKRNLVDALGHDWGDWRIVNYPTETENGSQERFCQRENCGAREEQTIIYGKFYLVTFYNYDGTRLMPPAYYEYGAPAIRPRKTPSKAADTAYTYEFVGWSYSDKQIDFVSERMAIIAKYEAHERYYNVTYKNDDGSVLATVNNVAFSQVAAAYPNPTPTKASDSAYDYTFGSWSINCDMNKGEAVATATYKATPRKYEPPADTGSSSEENLFTRIINWIKNLFNKLFGRG